MTAAEFRRDVVLPFVAGMASLAWLIYVMRSERYPEWVPFLALPGVFYANWKLAPFMWGWRKEGEDMGWNTNAGEFAQAVTEFETALPGFWWSVGQCSVGAHASCAVDGKGSQAGLLDGVQAGEPYDSGFHCDTIGGTPAEALRDVMRQAVEYMQRKG